MIEIKDLTFKVKNRQPILENVSFTVAKGQFVAILGENGAGKSSLLDILMGFKKPTSGSVSVYGRAPCSDIWEERRRIVYLSEKMDIPGAWSVKEFLEFNRFFYKSYSPKLEMELIKLFKVDTTNRMVGLSAGEVRRVQIVGALATQPELILIDEVTAVLDITGRRKLMDYLTKTNLDGTTVVLATNILEDLDIYAKQIMILSNGKIKQFAPIEQYQSKAQSFSQNISDILEAP